MADRVRMKSKSTFDNPFIFNHTKEREGSTTVIDDDEFSTEPEHAEQLVQAGMADKIDGAVSDRTDRQTNLKASQVSAGDAIATSRTSKKASTAPATPAA